MSENERVDPRNTAFRTVHEGPMTEVILIHAALAEAGLQPFIADANIKTIDPFITGLNPFSVRLQVPEDEVGEALDLIADLEERRARVRERGEDDEHGGIEWEDHAGEEDEDDEPEDEHEHDDVGADLDDRWGTEPGAPGLVDTDVDARRLATRTRWTAAACVAIPLLAPLLLHYLVRYYVVSRSGERPPYGDAVTIASAIAALVAGLAIVGALIVSFGR